MFKVNRKTIFSTLNIFHTFFFSVPNVEFGQTNVFWDCLFRDLEHSFLTTLNKIEHSMLGT